MKRFLLTGILFLALGQMGAHAQKRASYQDDIYFDKDAAKKQAEKEAAEEEARQAARNANTSNNSDNTYSSSGDESESNGNNETYNPGYASDGDEYIDYNDDDYVYSSRFRRFGSYYGYGYYTPFYDPFMYDPWYGYSPYYGPRGGMSMSFGFGGPYWSSYYGWSNWYGYPGFYSAWNYPMYAGGWGGYYNGYYDGYYSGFYAGNGGSYRSSTYGPRVAFNSPRSARRQVGSVTQPGISGGPRQVLRTSNRGSVQERQFNNSGIRTDRSVNNDRVTNTPGRTYSGDNMRMRSGRTENANPERQVQQAAPRAERRNRFFNGFNGGAANPNRNQGTTQQVQTEQAQPSRTVQRSQEFQAQPRSESRSSSPTYSAPSRSSGGGGGSMGGGSRGGGGRR